jgi:serine/threonine-protein kinase
LGDKAPTTSQQRNEPKGGTIIADRYQIDKLVARGGMAAVYLAHHVKLNRPVALKILSPPPDAEDSSAFEDRFRLEAETLAALDHPNIVILHDFGDLDDGRFFLAMEFIDGPRLSDVLRDGPLPCERALSLIMQVCSGLRYAHKRGVVHRDLKPSNLLIKHKDDGVEQLKVVDFGLVKLTEADQAITRAGLILGSPHCMAPEQVKGQKVDHRADIYAIGVLLFRTLTGQYPFHGPNSAATMIAHLNQPVPTFFGVAPELVVPEGLEEVVRKCLAKTAPERHQDMKALMDELAACMNVPPEQFRSVSQSQSSIQRRVAAPADSGRTRLLMAVMFMGMLASAGAALTINKILSGESPANVVVSAAGTAVEGEASDEAANEATGEATNQATDKPEVAPVVAPDPAPVPVATPKPVLRPRPKPIAPKPAPKPEPENQDADGYMGMPDDLLD